MIRPPFLARVAVGAAVFAIEEAQKLPTTMLNLPMNAVSQVLQTAMHAQQFVTSLAIKGDEALEPLIGGAVEQPEWATFDEDEVETIPEPRPFPAPRAESNGFHANGAAPAPEADVDVDSSDGERAEIVSRIDYPSLTLAQLRARLRYLNTDELDELLDYEKQDLARAPFVTMLTNRIATTKAP
ncbi:MAG: lipid droplet-associated protein [Mycobacteriaceae bacterium]|nr:lipid droplet-associated protein [Mycobacteriaceae bacterium]